MKTRKQGAVGSFFLNMAIGASNLNMSTFEGKGGAIMIEL
jgi:hypothetical protein